MGPLNNEGVRGEDGRARRRTPSTAAPRSSPAASAPGGFPTDLYWPATILDGVPADAHAATEETFGPIAPVVAIDSLEQAIELTNASPYGLLAAIFTADLRKGLSYAEQVRSGLVNINETTNYWENHLPFGGRAGTRQRQRPRRRALPVRGADRVADRRDRGRIVVGWRDAGSGMVRQRMVLIYLSGPA